MKGHYTQPSWHWSAQHAVIYIMQCLPYPLFPPSAFSQSVADLGCFCSVVVPRTVFATVEAAFRQLTPRHRPRCLSSGASISWISPFRHTRLPWQTLPLNLPSWPFHTHPWENLQMHPKQNTEARVRRLTGSRAPENTGQVPSCKEKRNDRL